MKKLYFLGPNGTYSEIGAKKIADFLNEEVELTPRTEREYPVENKPKPLKKKTPATFDSVMTEYTNDYHSTTPPDDVDKLIELIMSGK